MTKLFSIAALISTVGFGMLVPVMAQTSTSTATSTGTSTQVNNVDLACVQGAVSKRDAAVSSAFDAYYTVEKAALTARTSALSSAWAITDRKARRTAIAAAWKNFQTASKSAQKTYRAAKKTAWDTFTTDRKACGKGAAADDPTGRGVDDKAL